MERIGADIMSDRNKTPESSDKESNRLSSRIKRYAQVSTQMGGAAAKIAGARVLGQTLDSKAHAADLKAALGGLKGPIMKIAQMLATVPDALPEDYAIELASLQTNAPPMGWPFVRRRMAAELGPDWERRFSSFAPVAAAAASLGQVHRATSHEGRLLACKLQYPDMASAVEADLQQLRLIFALYRRLDRAIDPSEIANEVGLRLREELDYVREAAHIRLYSEILKGYPSIHVPEVWPDLSTKRLLTMNWLDGQPMLSFKTHAQEVRNTIARHLFHAWWLPFASHGVIHGDPHLGNYSVTSGHDLNLLDYGCVRTFQPHFVKGVIDLYRSLQKGDDALAVHAFETWGFAGLSKEIIDTLKIWARFIYAPMLDDRVRTVADGVKPSAYGRKEAFEVHSRLRKLGPVKPPKEFVFMDRAAIGLGGVFLHLEAQINFHQLFNAAIEGFTTEAVEKTQAQSFARAGVPLPAR